MQQLLDLVRSADPILLNSLAFFVGLILGHRIALARDKRQEFNAAVAPIRARFIRQADYAPSIESPSPVELDGFEHLMWWWRRAALRDAIERLQKSQSENCRQTADGDIYYVNKPEINLAASRVLELLKKR